MSGSLEEGEWKGERGKGSTKNILKELLTLLPLSKQLKPQGDTLQTCQLYPFILRAKGSTRVLLVL